MDFHCNFFISVFLLPIYYCYSQDEDSEKFGNLINCMERNRLLTNNDGDIYMLTAATLGQKLNLQCHFCKETDDHQPKIWYKLNLTTNSTPKEVYLGMESNSSRNRIHVNQEHSLIFQNISMDDTAFYYCLVLDAENNEKKYNYFIDVVSANETTPEIGNLTIWRKYHDETFIPINKLFLNSMNPEYEYMRQHLSIKIELITEWDSWGPCEICGRPNGQGQRRKKGFCRLKFSHIENNNKTKIAPANTTEFVLSMLYELSCSSLLIEQLLPVVSNVTKYLPNFMQIEQCEGTCNPAAEGLSKGWKTGKTLGFKYKKSYVLAEGAHLTLVCPESTLENVVIWRKNRKILNRGENLNLLQSSEPRIIIDTFNTLYLHDLTSEEEGNYTCVVGEIRMQQVRIYVVSKSRLITQAFVRHMMYLAFVLSLTLTCYCSGLFITCKKRHSFKTYEELKNNKDNAKKYDYENIEETIV